MSKPKLEWNDSALPLAAFGSSGGRPKYTIVSRSVSRGKGVHCMSIEQRGVSNPLRLNEYTETIEAAKAACERHWEKTE